MAIFSYIGKIESLSSGQIEERGTFSYDESAVVGLESTDFGFISEENTLDDDFGNVTDSTNYAYQRIDYGFLTPNTTTKPFGSINIINEFADASLVRNSVGGIVFLMYGSSITSITPLIFGGGSFLARGDAAIVSSPLITGSGTLFEFSSSTVAKTVKQDGAELFKLTSTTSHSFTPSPHIGSGSLFGFLSTTESYGLNPPETQALFRISGAITNERYTFSYFGTGHFNNIISHTEVVVYDYNESSSVIVDFDDYGFVGESPIFEDDYLTITDSALNHPWNFADYGYIIDYETRLPFGLFNIESATEIAFAPSNVTTGTINVFGDAKVFVLPIHIGSGVFKVQGSADPAASLIHLGSGKFSLISGTAESVSPNPPDSTALFDINGSASQAQSPSIFGTGFFKKIGGTAESLSSNPPESIQLFKISGSASNEQRAFGYNGTGSLFPISGTAERVAYAYNESSTVLLDFDDYGFIFESPTSERDDDLISNISISPGIAEDYGFLTPNASNLPFGVFNIESATEIVFAPSNVTTGTINVFGDAKVYILPLIIGKGFIEVNGDTRNAQSPAILGSGSLFGFSSATESIGSNPPESIQLFKISGNSTESTAPAPHVGSGSLFGFSSATESIGSNPPESIQLFKISGSASNEQRAFGYNGSGKLFAISGTAERVAYSYNETSIIAPDCLDYGFISAVPDYIPDPEENYGLITDLDIRLPWQKSNYGFIVDFETILPFGEIQISGNALTPLSIKFIGTGRLKLEGEVEVYVTPIHLGSGSAFISGESFTVFSLKHFGSGSLFGFSSTTESIGSNPPESTLLFNISGAATNEQRAFGYNGTGTLFTFISKTESTAVSQDDNKVLFKFSGNTTESITPAPHIGSGTLFTFISKTESVTSNPPESIQLFSISGAATNEQRAFGYNGTGTIGLGKSSPGLTGDGSRAITIFRLKHFGSGSLFGFSSTTESLLVIPTKDDVLFEIDGSSDNSRTHNYRTDIISVGSIDISGAATNEQRAFGYNGTGSISLGKSSPGLTGDGSRAITIFRLKHFGSGSLFGFSSTTESIGSNPPESTLLFNISGVSQNKLAKSIVSIVEAKLFGSAIEKNTESYVGSGSLFTFISATESISANPLEETVLFKFSGNAIEKNTESYVGSGSLFTFISKTESISANPLEETVLFKFSGNAIEKNTESYVGSGSLFGFSSTTESISVNPLEETVLFKFSGNAIEKNTESYVGSGSLFGFSSATESTSSVEVVKVLFKFSGNSAESTTPATHIGSGSLFTFISDTESTSSVEVVKVLFKFSGNAIEKNTESYVGSGSLFGFSSTTESTSSVEVVKVLFRFIGNSAESTTPATHIGSGSLFTFISDTESTSVAPTASTIFTFSGSAIEKNTGSYFGTGNISILSSASIAFIYNYKITKGLLRLSSRFTESFTPTTYNGSGLVDISGASVDKYVIFVPSRPTRIYII